MANRRVEMNRSAAPELVELFVHQLRMSSLKPSELCLVVTDMAYNPVYADACLGAALALGAEAYVQVLPFSHGLPRRSLAAGWREADLIVYMTTHTLHYSEPMREALAAGTRALMAVQPLHVMRRLCAHPDVIRRAKAGAGRLGNAKQIRITSDAGTDLVMDKTGRVGVATYGVADEPGHLDFWGGGMAQTAQIEGSANGTLVLDVGDCVFHLGRYIEQPVRITFRDGKAVCFEGGLDAFLVRTHLESFGEAGALMAGHMAWGVDRRAQWAAQAVQWPEPGASAADAESYYGNVQIEIGSNNDVMFGGKNASSAHLGLCMLNCSLWLDDAQVLDRGQFVPKDLQ